VLFYGVVSAQTEKVVEFFQERDVAEAMIREVRGESRCWRSIYGLKRLSFATGRIWKLVLDYEFRNP
jgi:hypothetical protein